MSDNILGLLGLMRRANALDIGETNSGAAVRAGRAKLLLLAADASDNARRRAETFVFGRRTILVLLPYTKAELSQCLGINGGSMAAVTDAGFANALMKALAEKDNKRYAATANEVEGRFPKIESKNGKRTSKRESRGTV